jgi:predicted Zn finger-like uncharacterized protein
MQIVCPACSAAYEVPMTLLRPGQMVRCARCAREWVPSPDAPGEPTVAPMTAAAAAPDWESDGIPPAPWPPQARAPMARPNVALRLAWAASVVAILALGWGAYAGRTTIMQVWPASVRLYAALGLQVDR